MRIGAGIAGTVGIVGKMPGRGKRKRAPGDTGWCAFSGGGWSAFFAEVSAGDFRAFRSQRFAITPAVVTVNGGRLKLIEAREAYVAWTWLACGVEAVMGGGMALGARVH